jgi:diguanylate cyclase (GGDEF)-like protein
VAVTTAITTLTSAVISWVICNAAVLALGLTFDRGLPTLLVRWGPFVAPLVVAPMTIIPRMRLQDRLREANLQLREANEQLREEIRQRIELQVALEYRSNHDSLTEVFNRGGFFDALRTVDGTEAVLVVIDVDRSKEINDTYGHAVGDVALRAVAGVLHEESTPAGGLVARLGGDEFVVLLPISHVTAAERIRERLERLTVATPDGDVIASAAVGVTRTNQGQSIDSALAAGDAAMYERKRWTRQTARQTTQPTGRATPHGPAHRPTGPDR